MRTFLCASIVVLCAAATASAQFANNPALKGDGKAAEADAAKPAEPPAIPADPAAAAEAPAAGPSAIFAALDLDADGTISKVELKKAIVSLKKLDSDNDGNITLAECAGDANGGAAAIAGNPATQWLDRIMAKDKNNDGKLTPNELNENERQMLQGADANNDGAIDRQELSAMQSAGPQGGPGNAFVGGPGAGFAGRAGNEAMGRFFQYDRNRDGRLTANEVPPQARGTLQGADLNGDGAIDAREMQATIAQMGDRAKAFGAGVDPNANGAGQGTPNANEPRNRKRREKNGNQ
jgi:Ca2+-binding EF-hand superfamily protein